MDLKEYEQRKFHLAEIIRSAQAIDTKDAELNRDCRELLARLAEDQFNLMVVGRFSRGKSTLMNAILGGDYLPTGIVPLTSVITTVRYGSRPQVVLHFRDSGLNREVPLSQMDEYVTQRGNPGNAKKIAWAEIQLPVEILRRGFFFVDTPGLGSPIIENTLTTERFLPQADAFILVTSYESPISEEEHRILQRIRNSGKPLFVTLNKRDTVTEGEREQARSFVTDQLTATLGRSIREFYSISARQALAAKVAQDQLSLEESGVLAFEHDLLSFLADDRAQSFLEGMYQRTLESLSRWSRLSDSRSHEADWAALLQRLLNQQESITGIQTAFTASAEIRGSEPDVWKLRIDKKAGCSICGSVLEATFRFLSKYQYDLTIRSEVQQEHTRRKGFCPLHTWQYEGISSPYGVCTAYPSLAHSVASQLNQIASDDCSSERRIDGLISTYQTCPACQVRRQAEEQAIADLAALASKTEAKGGEIPACCLAHLAPAIRVLGCNSPESRKLIAAHAALLERTAEDLERYALKHDALRRYLTSEEERRASQIALLLLAGHRNLSSPWTIEYIL
jgi:GTP-binding protein EngB required for normal cell division